MVTRIGEAGPVSEGAPQSVPFGESFDPLANVPETAERLANPRQAFYEDWQAWSCRDMPLDEQKKYYEAAVAAQIEQADEILGPKIKFAAEIYEWALFCEPRDTLPAGLAYSADKYSIISFTSDQARWAYEDAEPHLKEDQAINALVRLRSGTDFRSSIGKHVVEGLPEYAKLVALIADRPPVSQSQPLSPFKKQVALATIENDLLAKATGVGGQLRDLRQQPGLLRSYHRQVRSLDEKTEPYRVPEENAGDWRERLKKRLIETTQANRQSLHRDERAQNWSLVEISKDEDDKFVCAWLDDDVTEISTASSFSLAYHLRQETAGITGGPRYDMSYTYAAWEGLIGSAFQDGMTAAEALAAWSTSASESLLIRSRMDHSGKQEREEFIARPFLVVPWLPHGEHISDGARMAKNGLSSSLARNEAYDDASADPLMNINFGTQSEIDHEKGQVLGDVHYNAPITDHHMRLVTESSSTKLELPRVAHDLADIAVRTTGSRVPDIIGYKAIGRSKDYDTTLYRYDRQTDLYVPPSREEMLIDRSAVADFIGSMGLGIMAKDLYVQSQVGTIKDFGQYISWRTTYYKPRTEQEAEELAREFSSGNWGALLDSEGRVRVQCTVASALAGMALVATSDHRLEYVGGNTLPLQDGIISSITHSQLLQRGPTRKYIFDPTPSMTASDTPPDWQKRSLLGMFARRPSWANKSQLPDESVSNLAGSTPDSAEPMQPQASIVDSIVAAQPLTTEEKVEYNLKEAASTLNALESQLRQLFAINAEQDLYKAIAQVVPGPKRSKEPLWRCVSLLRKATLSEGDIAAEKILDEQIRAEIQYIHNLQKADRATLTKIGMDCPDPAMTSILLASLHRSLQNRR